MIELIQGDCLDKMKDIPDGSIDLILTDPPFDIKNTKIGSSSFLEKSWQGSLTEIKESGISSGFDYLPVLNEMLRVNKNVNMYIWCNKAQLPLYINFFVTERGCSFDLIKWVKTNAVPCFNNKYCSDTEYCFYARKGGYCNPRDYIDASTLYQGPINAKDKFKYNHPTIKPLDIIKRLIRNSSKERQTILDPFMGSGTTGVACKLQRRNFIGIELNPEYLKIAEKRIASINAIQEEIIWND